MKTKNKIWATLIGLVLLLFLCFKLAVGKTIELQEEFHTLQSKNEYFQNLPGQLILLTDKKEKLDSTLFSLNLENESNENNILKFLNERSDSLQVHILDFNEAHIIKDKTGSSVTYTFIIEGGYNSLLKVIHAIETKSTFGKVKQVSFDKVKRKKTKLLQAMVMIESFE
ncbi:hypothetical protein [Flagellimonas sp.]|uniref:hypothetical protein n=1 Tax=Flagellimonas sp. TaxID=2058762 RepID=UPI003F4A59B1